MPPKKKGGKKTPKKDKPKPAPKNPPKEKKPKKEVKKKPEKPKLPEEKPKLIIHPGSLNLRIGLSSSPEPTVIPHCIGRRLKFAPETDTVPSQIRGWSRGDPSEISIEDLKILEPKLITQRKGKFDHQNAHTPLVVDSNGTENQLHTTYLYAEDDDFLVGEDVLKILPTDPYTVHFPFRYGYINRGDQSIHATESNIEILWKTVITQRLRIKFEDFKEYPVILIVPDMFQKCDLVALCQILFESLHFPSVFIQKESIYSVICANKSSSCVVDFGHTKTTVSCVEEGTIIPGTTFHLTYGGDDISTLFLKLLNSQRVTVQPSNNQSSENQVLQENLPSTQSNLLGQDAKTDTLPPAPQTNLQSSEATSHDTPTTSESQEQLNFGGHYFPFSECSLSFIRDLTILQNLKETCCHLSKKPIVLSKSFPVYTDHKGSGSILSLSMSGILSMAPSGIFFPQVFTGCSFRDHFTGKKQKKYQSIPDLEWTGISEKEIAFTEGVRLHSDVLSVEFANQIGMKWQPLKAQKRFRERQNDSPPPKKHKPALESKKNSQDNLSEQVNIEEPTEEKAKLIRMVVPDFLIDQRTPIAIQRAIVESIEQTPDKEKRKKFYENILITGGSSMFQGLKESLEDSLTELVPREIKNVEIFTGKDLVRDPTMFAWQGAQLSSSFLSPRDFISNERWHNRHVSALREKLHFSFDNPDNRKYK